MVKEVALITVSCVLFVQMGLSGAISEVLHVRFRILSCPRCATFWVTLAWTLATRHHVIDSVATSFIASYCALWLSLIYDSLALIYNYLYEQITQNPGASADAERSDSPADIQAGSDEVPQMQ